MHTLQYRWFPLFHPSKDRVGEQGLETQEKGTRGESRRTLDSCVYIMTIPYVVALCSPKCRIPAGSSLRKVVLFMVDVYFGQTRRHWASFYYLGIGWSVVSS
jgi:hypothetical protein